MEMHVLLQLKYMDISDIVPPKECWDWFWELTLTFKKLGARNMYCPDVQTITCLLVNGSL